MEITKDYIRGFSKLMTYLKIPVDVLYQNEDKVDVLHFINTSSEVAMRVTKDM